MERVTGIGGVFFRAKDPETLVAWYAKHLGIPVQPDGYVVFEESRSAHVWAPFREDTDYWPAEKAAMVNFIVPNLDAMLAQLRSAGVEVDEKVEDLEASGASGGRSTPRRTASSSGSPLADEHRVLVEEIPQNGLLRRSHLV